MSKLKVLFLAFLGGWGFLNHISYTYIRRWTVTYRDHHEAKIGQKQFNLQWILNFSFFYLRIFLFCDLLWFNIYVFIHLSIYLSNGCNAYICVHMCTFSLCIFPESESSLLIKYVYVFDSALLALSVLKITTQPFSEHKEYRCVWTVNRIFTTIIFLLSFSVPENKENEYCCIVCITNTVCLHITQYPHVLYSHPICTDK